MNKMKFCLNAVLVILFLVGSNNHLVAQEKVRFKITGSFVAPLDSTFAYDEKYWEEVVKTRPRELQFDLIKKEMIIYYLDDGSIETVKLLNIIKDSTIENGQLSILKIQEKSKAGILLYETLYKNLKDKGNDNNYTFLVQNYRRLEKYTLIRISENP